MQTHLVKQGDSWALIIDQSLLETLKIDPDAPVELTLTDETLTIAAAEPGDLKTAVREARKQIQDRYSDVFQKLA